MAKKVEAKSFLRSRTLWFNVVTILLGVVQVVSNVYYIPTDILALINGIGNVLLRFLTKEKLAF